MNEARSHFYLLINQAMFTHKDCRNRIDPYRILIIEKNMPEK